VTVATNLLAAARTQRPLNHITVGLARPGGPASAATVNFSMIRPESLDARNQPPLRSVRKDDATQPETVTNGLGIVAENHERTPVVHDSEPESLSRTVPRLALRKKDSTRHILNMLEYWQARVTRAQLQRSSARRP
jgi:hypothetical protein